MNTIPTRSDRYNLKGYWQEKNRIRIKTKIKEILIHWPLVYEPLLRLWRLSKFILIKLKWKLLIGVKDSHWQPDIHKKLWISPKKIVYSSLQEFSIYDFNGRIIGGNWDHQEKKFDDLDIHVAFKQVVLEGKSWADTIFYQRILNRLNHGDFLWNCKDQNDLQERCRKLESLYHKINEEGYKSQEELLQLSGEYEPLRLEDEVIVGIGRHGDMLFCNSAHRLVIAKLLNIPQIPVKVAVRHPEWIKLRKELFLYAKDLGGKTYQTIAHPDLKDIPAFHECENRFCLIKENLTARGGKLLDIGANIGYFCHHFEEEGFDCYAIENYKRELYFLHKLKRAENRKFTIIDASILDYPPIHELQFDVILALNTFHHFLKTELDYYKFIKLLRGLKFKEMFFEPHHPHEDQMVDAYRNYSPDEFVAFILENSGLKQAEIIGQDNDGRFIYKLIC